MSTIRKNSLTKIRAMLEAAALITRYHDDGMEVRSERATVDQVMSMSDRFSSVTTEHVTIYSCFFFTIYHSREDAKRRLTARAFDEYFGEVTA
jgi:hypothetical protein